MTSKRTHSSDVSEDDIDFNDFIEKKVCTELKPKPTVMENVIFQLMPMSPGTPIRIAPTASTSQSYIEPSGGATIVPTDARGTFAGDLTSEIEIKQESDDDDDAFYLEQDILYERSLSNVPDEPIQKATMQKDTIQEETFQKEPIEEQGIDLLDYYYKGLDEFKKKYKNWTEEPSPMQTFHFTKEQKYLKPMSKDPYDLFRLFFDDTLLDMIVDETNKKALRSESFWHPLTRVELLVFIGIIIHTGTINLHRLSDYWNNHYLFSIKCFQRFMLRRRFVMILDYLSFSSAKGADDINAIQPVIDHFNNTMKRIYQPGANLIVNKSVTICNGKVLSDESKRKKFANNRLTKVHILAEPKGTVLKLHVTHGFHRYESVVFDLLAGRVDCGRSVYLPEEYNTFEIPLLLLGRNTHCTGPISEQLVENMERSLSSTVRESLDLLGPNGSYFCDGMHLCKLDKQYYLSSQYDNELLHVPTSRGRVAKKSKLVAMYNSVMNVDFEENMFSYYPCREHILPWHKKVFIHVIQIAIVNAFKCHAEFNRFYKFRLDILEKLLPAAFMVEPLHNPETPHVLTKIEKTKPRARKLLNGEPTVTIEVIRKECRGCRMEKRNKRTSTIYECRQCPGSPGYCESCFARVHQPDSD